MQTLVKTPSGKSLAIKYGFIWSAINIVLFLVLYYGLPQYLGTVTQNVIQVVIGLTLAIYFTLRIRKEIGGYWSFSEALKNIFILFIIPTVVLYFFSLFFGKWIEPTYPDKIKELTLNATTELMETWSDDQEEIDKAIEDAEIAMEKQFNPSFVDVVKSIGFSVIVYFIGAMVWAAIFKRDRPLFNSTGNHADLIKDDE